jgi:hypothetical protein
MKTKVLQAANILGLVITLLVNYLSNTGIFNNTTIGDVSGNYRTLFTPAGYAFAIWGVIYLLLIGFALYQGRGLLGTPKNPEIVNRTGWWFVASCAANSLWVITWIYGHTGLSVLCIFLLLYCLIRIVLIHRMELWDAPLGIIAFLWWPFVIYSGWVTVASIANVSAWLKKLEWNGFGLSEVIWTLAMIVVATVLNLVVTWRRNMREFAAVGAWALIAIAMANKDGASSVYYLALLAAAVLLLSSLWHAWRNRDTNPLIKLKEALNR